MLNRLAAARRVHGVARAQPVPQHRRTEHREQQAPRRAPRRESPPFDLQLARVDRPSVAGLVYALERGARQPVDDRRRAQRRHLAARAPLCISTAVITVALSDSLVLLEIERDLIVAELGQERPDDEPRGRSPRIATIATIRAAEHRAVAVVERVHRVRRERPRRAQLARDGDRRPAQRALGAISVPNAAHDTEELRLLATAVP